ncbi:MAG: hypothetical protein R3C68_19310 [Myxococcota bacterium]
MKLALPLLSVFTFLCITPLTARAEIFATTESLAAGKVAVAAEFAAGLIDETIYALNLQEEVGLASGLDLRLRQGFGLNQGQPIYLEGGVKWTLVHASPRHRRPGVALWLGGHVRTDGDGFGGDATVSVDYAFQKIRPYVGLDANLDFINDDTEVLLALILGAKYRASALLAVFIEGGVDIVGPDALPTAAYAQFISGGIKLYF